LEYCRELSDNILPALSLCTELQSLNLNGITKFTGGALKNFTMALPDLKDFQLFYRGGGTIDVTELAEGLLHKCNKLTKLTLRQVGVADAISEVIKVNCKHLTKLDLSICQITDKTASEIANCSELLELQLQGSTLISEEVLNNIAKRCLHLVVVGFQGVRSVTDETIRLFNPIPGTRHSLHTLLLDGCEQPTMRCLEDIANHTELRFLSLKRCPCVTAEGVLALGRTLTKLNVMDISLCPRLPKNTLIVNNNDQYDILAQELVVTFPLTTIIYN